MRIPSGEDSLAAKSEWECQPAERPVGLGLPGAVVNKNNSSPTVRVHDNGAMIYEPSAAYCETRLSSHLKSLLVGPIADLANQRTLDPGIIYSSNKLSSSCYSITSSRRRQRGSTFWGAFEPEGILGGVYGGHVAWE